ncbi:hypothetical protein VPH35_104489 [Triticum aestivum]
MASHLHFSASGSSSGASSSASPPPPSLPPPPPRPSLQSIVVGSAMGPLHPAAMVMPPGACVDRVWRSQGDQREKRRSPLSSPRGGPRSSPRAELPSNRPPVSRMPPRLFGCCYNCGQPDHISRKCFNETLCVRCNLPGHHSRDCKRPRSPLYWCSHSGLPRRSASVWRRIRHRLAAGPLRRYQCGLLRRPLTRRFLPRHRALLRRAPYAWSGPGPGSSGRGPRAVRLPKEAPPPGL